jgi:DNA-directed RNA polymerase
MTSEDQLEREMASRWVGHVKRDTVKRAVMTTPYGVTNVGIGDQLRADEKIPDVFSDVYEDDFSKFKASIFMTKLIVKALDGSIGQPRAIMRWLQDCASKRAKAGLPMLWTTPTGSVCRQAYTQRKTQRVDTSLGRLTLDATPEDAPLDSRKQAAGAAPNVVHSFDASHLADVVNRCVTAGIRDFAAIHDSFGVHAAYAGIAAEKLRVSFAWIYSQPVLQRLYEEFQVDGIDILPPPAQGNLQIDGVLYSQFFFS